MAKQDTLVAMGALTVQDVVGQFVQVSPTMVTVPFFFGTNLIGTVRNTIGQAQVGAIGIRSYSFTLGMAPIYMRLDNPADMNTGFAIEPNQEYVFPIVPDPVENSLGAHYVALIGPVATTAHIRWHILPR